MTTVTKLVLRSGDRAALDGVVGDIRETVHRKGAELRGPHSEAPTDHRVPLYRRLDGDDDAGAQFSDWTYTSYTRRLEIVGHETLVSVIVDRSFPDSVHVEVEVEHIRSAGT